MRVLFQIGGMEMAKDDGLIYERVLREEVRKETRVDAYRGGDRFGGRCFRI